MFQYRDKLLMSQPARGMNLTPTSGRFQLTPAEDEDVIKTFSSIKEWLSTPKTPSFVKNKVVDDAPSF